METITRDKDLEQFFLDALQKLYWAEQRRSSLLEDLKENAFSPGLVSIIELQQTHLIDQLRRQREVFHLLKQEAREQVCEAFNGIITDAEVMVLQKKRKTRVRDLSIMTSLERIVHYMMASYTMLIHFCGMLEWTDVETLLKPSLRKEHEAEEAIGRLAAK